MPQPRVLHRRKSLGTIKIVIFLKGPSHLVAQWLQIWVWLYATFWQMARISKFLSCLKIWAKSPSVVSADPDHSARPQALSEHLSEYPLLAGLPLSLQGVEVLGLPLGPPEFQQDFVRQAVADTTLLLDKLQHLDDGRTHYQLTRFCVCLKLHHLTAGRLARRPGGQQPTVVLRSRPRPAAARSQGWVGDDSPGGRADGSLPLRLPALPSMDRRRRRSFPSGRPHLTAGQSGVPGYTPV